MLISIQYAHFPFQQPVPTIDNNMSNYHERRNSSKNKRYRESPKNYPKITHLNPEYLRYMLNIPTTSAIIT